MLRNVLCTVFCLWVLACASAHYPDSDHFKDGTFFNPWAPQVGHKSLFELLKWKIGGETTPWPDWLADNEEPRLQDPVHEGEVQITFINHASYLLQFADFNLLTDPVFSKRVSPLSWIGPARHRPPGIAFDALPKIHFVMISHNHYDHMDMPSLQKLAATHDPLFIVPLGSKARLENNGIRKTVELDWWQSQDLLPQHRVHIVPEQHWTSRGVGDRNKELWGGYVLESSGLKIYFAGDTGYGPHFRDTFTRFGPMDISLLPIGAYEPRWFMKDQHMNPAEAVQAHLDLHSRQSLGMHYGTFQLTDEGIDQPVTDLQQSLHNSGIDSRLFIASRNGQTFRFSRTVLDSSLRQ